MNDIRKIFTSDDLIFRIRDEMQVLHDAKTKISKQNEKVKKLKLTVDSVLPVNQSKQNVYQVAQEFKNFQRGVDSFNQSYIEHGDFISKYFEYELDTLYNFANSIINSFHTIFIDSSDVSFEILSNLHLIQLAIEFIVNELNLLWNNAYKMDLESNLAEKIKLEELRRIEYESEIDVEYKNNIRKSINNICSQIISENLNHSIGRLEDLIKLLNNEDIPLVGSNNQTINLKNHPRATEICWSLLQQAVIEQAQSQFCVNLDTAIVFSSLLVALLGKFPNQLVGMLNALETKFWTLINSVEINEDEQLNSLIGLARLVAGISVVHPPPGFITNPDLGPARLWRLLAIICNEQTVSPLFAQVCLGLLEVGGNSLWTAYGNQFEKLLIALQMKFSNQKNLTVRAVTLLINNALEKKTFEIIR